MVKIGRSDSHQDRNHFEEMYYSSIGNRRIDGIPQTHGWVETQMGRGLVLDAIRNCDGTISRTLPAAFLDHEINQAEGEILLSAFFSRALKSGLMLYDDNPCNFLLQKTLTGRQLVMVDGFGPRSWTLKSTIRQRFPLLGSLKTRSVRRATLQAWSQLVTSASAFA